MLQKVKALFLVAILAFAACKPARKSFVQPSAPAEVQVLATIHKFHLNNHLYPYGKVTALIRKFNPDLIGIEIRPEDLREDQDYLAQFYPLEMRQVLLDFPRDKVYGLDWYGDEMKGQKLPADVFKNEATELGNIKKLERQMNHDSLVAPKLLPLVALGERQVELAKTASPAQLNNGEYDVLTRQFYTVLEAAAEGTRFQKYTNFNRRRDEIIAENIVKLVQENPGKRIIFLIGANHRAGAINALKKLPADKIKIIPVED